MGKVGCTPKLLQCCFHPMLKAAPHHQQINQHMLTGFPSFMADPHSWHVWVIKVVCGKDVSISCLNWASALTLHIDYSNRVEQPLEQTTLCSDAITGAANNSTRSTLADRGGPQGFTLYQRFGATCKLVLLSFDQFWKQRTGIMRLVLLTSTELVPDLYAVSIFCIGW